MSGEIIDISEQRFATNPLKAEEKPLNPTNKQSQDSANLYAFADHFNARQNEAIKDLAIDLAGWADKIYTFYARLKKEAENGLGDKDKIYVISHANIVYKEHVEKGLLKTIAARLIQGAIDNYYKKEIDNLDEAILMVKDAKDFADSQFASGTVVYIHAHFIRDYPQVF